MSKQLYRLCLDDFSSASFCSFEKYYFGTLDDIKNFIDAIRSDEKLAEKFANLINTFDKYMAGEKNIKHNVAYREMPFLVRAKCLDTTESMLTNYNWEHINTWQWPYDMRCKEAKSSHVWISCQGEYMRCIRTEFIDLEYEHFNGRWDEPGMIWGYPHQIEFDNNRTYNRLFVAEKLFKNKTESLEDIEKFKINPDPNFKEVLDDIFGDG